MFTLEQLETAVRSQFVWDKTKYWQVDINFDKEMPKNLGLTLFIGLANFHGFDKEAIVSFISKNRKVQPSVFTKGVTAFDDWNVTGQYDIACFNFKRYMVEIEDIEMCGSLGREKQISGMLYNKLQLVQAYLKLNFGVTKFMYLRGEV